MCSFVYFWRYSRTIVWKLHYALEMPSWLTMCHAQRAFLVILQLISDSHIRASSSLCLSLTEPQHCVCQKLWFHWQCCHWGRHIDICSKYIHNIMDLLSVNRSFGFSWLVQTSYKYYRLFIHIITPYILCKLFSIMSVPKPVVLHPDSLLHIHHKSPVWDCGEL